MPAFWAAHGQPIVHLERGAYGVVARPKALLAVAVVLLPYLALLVLFVAGVAALPRGRAPAAPPRVPRSSTCSSTSPPTATRATGCRPCPSSSSWPPRAGSAARGRARAAPGPDRAHRLAAAAAALVLGLSVGPSLLGWATRPWPPPWFAGAGVEGGPEAPPPGETPQQEGP